MMLKQLIRYHIRKWWPLLVIFTVIASSSFWIACNTQSITYPTNAPYYLGNSSISCLLQLTIILSGMSIAMPLFVFRYRFSKQVADVIYQAPYSPNTIKRTRVLIGLVILLIAFTASFLLGLSVYILRYYAIVPAEGYAKHTIYWQYYLAAYGLILVLLAAEYFVNCFLVSLGNYFFDALFLVLFGNVFLSLMIIGPAIYYLSFVGNLSGEGTSAFGTEVQTSILMYHFGAAFMPMSTYMLLDPLISSGHLEVTTIIANLIVSTGLYVSFGVLCFFGCFYFGDPSGEEADKAGFRNKAIALIPHGAAFVIGLSLSMFNNALGIELVSAGVYHILFFAIYYALLSAWRHSFRPTKTDLICYLCVCGTILFLRTGLAISLR